MTIGPGEHLPTAVPIPGTTAADENLENPLAGPAGGLTEEQAGLSPEGGYLVTNKVLTANVATLTTDANHSFTVGDTVLVDGVDGTFNGQVVVTAVTANTFSYAVVAANVGTVASAGGTAIGADLMRGQPRIEPHQPAAQQALPNTDKGVIG